MHQLLSVRTRLCPMHPETRHQSLLCASSYSLGSQMPKPHLPHRRDSKAVSGCCPTSTPDCPNCGDDHDAFSRECKARPVPPPQPKAPPPSDEELSDASSDSEEAMDVGDDGRPAPTAPDAPSTRPIDLSTPRPPQQPRDAPAPPSRSQPAPTGRGLLPVTPLIHRAPPGTDQQPLLHLAPRTGSGD